MTVESSHQPRPHQPGRGYIGLSFSGGGYRATAFSLGTMALLHDLGLLSKARVMSSVSGGSLALAAYLCAKAGARLSQEADFPFYERFWDPLLLALSGETLASSFVRLPLLLQGEKLILHAADATQRFLSSLLGQEACLGNQAITDMLRNVSLSPDYVFFNSANIASLDLFRFGIQRGSTSQDSHHPPDPVYVLNRYYLQAEGGPLKANELYRHAAHLRLGDCVAASFAFPGGFEPLIFPHDYFRPGHSPAGDAEAARQEFRGSLICDRNDYVALLDGGLYDNLGLASIEDIRRFLLRRQRDLRHPPQSSSTSSEQRPEKEQPIHYVIATDVDNIQPGIGFYKEPGLEPQVPNPTPPRASAHSGGRQPKPWGGLVRSLVGVMVLTPGLTFLFGVLLGLLLAVLIGGLPPISFPVDQWPGSLRRGLPALLGGLAVLGVLAVFWIAVACRQRIRRSVAWIRSLISRGMALFAGQARTSTQTWRQSLGLSRNFDHQGIDNDLTSFLLRAVMAVLKGPDRAQRWGDLKAATLERRIGQLLPAFNGYLKRTRSLTYGYLQQTYDLSDRQAMDAKAIGDGEERCHLIRNMVFELIPGPDADPAFAANLITLPVQDYDLQKQIEPEPPIIRKLRHANYVRDLLGQMRRGSLSVGSSQGLATPPMELPLQLLKTDDDLRLNIDQLNLHEAAAHWTWLTKSLSVYGQGCAADPPNPTIRDVVKRVHDLLRDVWENPSTDGNPNKASTLLRQRCEIKIGENAASYSWIPLICEMATNLNTTLWVEGFRWYVPNQLKGQRIERTGGWYVDRPSLAPEVLGNRPVLDLGRLRAPAGEITALAGYLNMAFNLLDFFYTSLGSSTKACTLLLTLVKDQKGNHWKDLTLPELRRLPFALRQRTHWKLERQTPPSLLPQELSILEPWLLFREGFPETWWETSPLSGA